MGRERSQALLKDEGIVRHRGKIEAAISNAKAFLELEFGPGFSQFLWGFVDGKPKQNAYKQMADMPAVTPESTAMAKALKSNGFRFCGPTTLACLHAERRHGQRPFDDLLPSRRMR